MSEIIDDNPDISNINLDKEMNLFLDLNQISLFDANTEERI